MRKDKDKQTVNRNTNQQLKLSARALRQQRSALAATIAKYLRRQRYNNPQWLIGVWIHELNLHTHWAKRVGQIVGFTDSGRRYAIQTFSVFTGNPDVIVFRDEDWIWENTRIFADEAAAWQRWAADWSEKATRFN